jgi:hypothetical protein
MTQITHTPAKRYALHIYFTSFSLRMFLVFPLFDAWHWSMFTDRLLFFFAYSIYSRTDSSASLELRNGRLVAIAHHVPKTGYKAVNSYGHKPRFVSETTSKTAQKACFAAPAKTRTKPLTKYHPWAARNRPKQFTENVVGRRFGFNSANTTAKETYRGSSQICLGDESIKNTFQTTNRAFQQVSVNSRSSKEKSLAMMTNQGIASDVARRLHAKLMPRPELETKF